MCLKVRDKHILSLHGRLRGFIKGSFGDLHLSEPSPAELQDLTQQRQGFCQLVTEVPYAARFEGSSAVR